MRTLFFVSLSHPQKKKKRAAVPSKKIHPQFNRSERQQSEAKKQRGAQVACLVISVTLELLWSEEILW